MQPLLLSAMEQIKQVMLEETQLYAATVPAKNRVMLEAIDGTIFAALVLFPTNGNSQIGQTETDLALALQYAYLGQQIHNNIGETEPGSVKAATVLLGDYFIAKSFNLIAKADASWWGPLTQVLKQIAQVRYQKCLLEKQHLVSLDQVLYTINAEYGALGMLAGQMGGALGGLSAKDQAGMAQFGRELAVIYGMMRENRLYIGEGQIEPIIKCLNSLPSSLANLLKRNLVEIVFE